MSEKVRIHIDGHEIEVAAGRNLLQAVLEAGVDLPYFCWHPELGAVGACRQCAVTRYRDEDDEHGRVDMACMTPCTDGLRISVADEQATAMRKAVIEFLMTNHPHDCPVCEEGGECHLQDMTVMAGQTYRRYRGRKRTHRNQDLGPFVAHEMNRCIACYRCTRYYRDYAGGTDLDVFGAHNHVYFGRAEDGSLESPFAGNLVEVCPTGVFTDKTLSEHYSRKWDLQSAPSVCSHCAVGCNTLPGERYGRLKRVWNRYHGEVNGYFLCDRGRYGYGFVNAADRPRQVSSRAGLNDAAGVEQAMAYLSDWVGAKDVACVGSPRASLEANFALQQLFGADHFFRGEPGQQQAASAAALRLLGCGAHIASARQIERCDAALVIGEDLTHSAPRLALSLRQSTRQKGLAMAQAARIAPWQDAAVRTLAQDVRSPLYIGHSHAGELDGLAAGIEHGTPARLLAWAQEIAAAIREGSDHPVARDLLAAQRPLLITGTSLGSAALIDAVTEIAVALQGAGREPFVHAVFPESNSVGCELLGGQALEALLSKIEEGAVKRLLVLENDLFRRVPAPRLQAALQCLDELVVLDCIRTRTVDSADWVLPAASFAEGDGTYINSEGRAQRAFQVHQPLAGDIAESWRWLQWLGEAASQPVLGRNLDDLLAELAQARPDLAGVRDAAPDAARRIGGSKVARMSHRSSGRTAMHAHRSVHEPQQPADADTPLAFSMEGASVLTDKPAATIPIFWAPRWNSGQSLNKFQQEIGGPMRGGDAGVRLLGAARGLDMDCSAHPCASPELRSSERADSVPANRSRFRGNDGDISVPPRDPSSPRKRGSLDDEATLLAVPLHHIFGSEELSQRSEPIRERAGNWPARMHPQTAEANGVAHAASVRVMVAGESAELPLKLDSSLPQSVVGLPAGCPGVPYFDSGDDVVVEAAE